MSSDASVLDENAFSDLMGRLLSSGLLRDGRLLAPDEGLEWRKRRDVVVAVCGGLRCGDDEVPVRVGLPRDFPSALPEVAVDDRSLLPLPHTEEDDGRLCYDRDANLVDRHDPYAVIAECVTRAATTLDTAVHGERGPEYAQEIGAYWTRIAKTAIAADVAPGDQPHETTAILSRGVLLAVADDPKQFARSTPSRSTEHLSFEKAVYIPISPGRNRPDFEPRALTDVNFIRSALETLPGPERARTMECLPQRPKRRELVVLGVERPRGARALVALQLSARDGHPLGGGKCTNAVPIALERRDRHYLFERSGAQRTRSAIRILLVGCGAIGGHFAVSMARAGVGRLTLVDHDRFTMENALRHVAGMAYVGERKAEGLKRFLETSVPFVEVASHVMRIEDLLRKGPGTLTEHDLIVCATGHPTVELGMNERLWNADTSPAALFAWLEPLGLGGHVLATRVPDDAGVVARGCFECVHRRAVQGGPIVNDAAFALPEATYTRDLLGCGDSYLPYGDVDAVRTANLAGRLALEIMDGVMTAPALASWKGSDRGFKAAGFSTTPRYEALTAEEVVSNISRENCPACGGGQR